MDAGAEYHGYVSDVTRTWPVNGRFTEAQRDLYEAVLRVKEECIKVSECVCVCVCVNISNNGSGSRVFKKFKNFVQVDIDEVYTSTKFCGCGLFSFGNFAPFSFAFKTAKISLRAMDYSPWGSKNRIGSKNSCK